MRIIAYSQPHLSRAMMLFVFVVTVSVFLYCFFLLETVAHAASLTRAQAEVQALTVTVGTLEAQYLSATQAITPQTAQTLGFTTPTQVSIVYAGAGTILTLRNE